MHKVEILHNYNATMCVLGSHLREILDTSIYQGRHKV